jgi:hypothetical protein
MPSTRPNYMTDRLPMPIRDNPDHVSPTRLVKMTKNGEVVSVAQRDSCLLAKRGWRMCREQ